MPRWPRYAPHLLLALAAPAAAQEPVQLDTVRVEAASRAAGALVSATRAAEVIDAERIRRLPAATVSEVLRWALGVELMPRSPALADVGIRGSSFEQVLVLVDGVRVSDAQTGHFDLDLAVPLDQVERVEVLRGPASTQHGADAVGGVIHIVTRRGRGGTRARAEAGTWSTHGLALSHAMPLAGAWVDVGGEARRSDGHRDGTDWEMATGRVALSAPLAGGSLAADLAHAARDFGAAGFYGPYPAYERTRASTASLAWRADGSRAAALEPTLSLRRHTDDFLLRRTEPNGYRNQHETLDWGGSLVGRAAVAGMRAAAGVEGFEDRLRSRALGDREERRAAAFGELAAGAVGRWTAAAGLRADWREEVGDFWSPSASAAWWPARPVRLRGSLGRAFRAPTWTERYYRDPANIGSADLRPERAWSAELGAEAWLPRDAHLSLSAWRREAEDLIDWARPARAPATEPWRTRNVQSARFRGVEAEAAARDPWGTRWTLRGSALSLEASDAAGFASKYALRPLAESVLLAAERRVGERLGLWAGARRERRRGEDARLLLDARATLDVRRLRLHLDLQNLTDEPYLDVVGLPAPGRALTLGAEWAPRR